MYHASLSVLYDLGSITQKAQMLTCREYPREYLYFITCTVPNWDYHRHMVVLVL